MADSKLGVVITARDEASHAFKSASASLEKVGLDAKKAADLTRQSWVQGFDAKGINAAQKSLQRLGLSSKEAQAALRSAGVSVGEVEQATAKATGATSRFRVSLSGIGSSISGFGRQATMASALIAAPFIAGAAWAGKLAMQSVETANLYKVSMGEMEGAGTRWIAAMNAAYGLNTRALQSNLGMFQSWFTSMGFAQQSAYGMSTALTKLAYDFSSFYNVGADEAFTKIQSAMAGETEAVRRWGIDVSDAAVKTYALKNGLADSNDELSQAQKAWIRYALLLQQSSNAQGDLARTMNSPANQLRLLRERVEQLATEVGQRALPIISSALTWLNDTALPRVRAGVDMLGETWKEMSEVAKRRVIAIAALLVAGGPLLQAFGAAIRGLALVGAGFKVLASFALGRIALIVGGIALAVEAIYQMRNGLVDMMEEQGRTLVKQAAYWEEMGRLSNNGLLRGYAATMGLIGRELIPNLAQSARSAMPAVERLHSQLIQMGSDALTGEFDGLAESVEKLGANVLAGASDAFDKWAQFEKTIKSDAEYMRDAAKAASGNLAAYQPPKIDKAAFDALASGLEGAGDKAKEAKVNIGDLTSALVANSAITRTAAVAVAYWESQVAATNLALEANRDQLQAAQSDLQGMQDHLSGLNAELSNAKSRLDDFTGATLTGMGAAADQIFEAEQAIKRLQLQELNWEIAGGVGDSPFKKQIEAAQRELQRMQLTQSITFDPQTRALDQLANPRQEMSYDEAAAGIVEWKARVAELTKAVQSQEAAIRGQEAVVKSIQIAADALNKTLAYQQQQLELSKQNFEGITKALTAAFGWFLQDREEIRKLGPEGVAASDAVDEATKTLLLGLTQFAGDNTVEAQKNIAQMVSDYEAAVNRIKAMLNGIGGPGVPSIGAATGSAGGYRAIVDGRVVYDGPSQNAAEVAYNNNGGGGFTGDSYVEKHDYPGIARANVPYRIGTEEVFMSGSSGYITPIGGAKVSAGAPIDYDQLAGAIVRALGSATFSVDVNDIHTGLVRRGMRNGQVFA